MTTATAAIANHLNVAASAIVEIQEWARVLWVRIKGVGARFVSKKVVEVKPVFDLEAEIERREKGAAENYERAMAMQSEILDSLPQWAAASVQDDILFDSAVNILEGRESFNDVVARLTSKKVVIRR
jgi:hypothetical protein